MKKNLLLLLVMLVCQSQLSAQFTGPGVFTYDITVIRDDDYSPGHVAYANASVKLDIKIGATEMSKTFAQIHTPTNPNPISQNYTFPVLLQSPGTPALIKYAKVSFTYPSNLFGGYYPLPTTIGDHVTIAEPCMIDYDAQYGYGVGIYYTAPNQYTMKVTKFTCYLCIRPIDGCGIASKNVNPNREVTLVPNPSIGLSELYYTSTGKETISLNVTDLNGKVIKAYTIDTRAGLNKLSIDLQNQIEGTYIINWQSSNSTKGSLKMVKNR